LLERKRTAFRAFEHRICAALPIPAYDASPSFVRDVPPPAWVRDVEPMETEPRFATPLAGLRLHLLRTAPVPFKRRNIFIDSSIGDRV
jgi:hypothetical protein